MKILHEVVNVALNISLNMKFMHALDVLCNLAQSVLKIPFSFLVALALLRLNIVPHRLVRDPSQELLSHPFFVILDDHLDEVLAPQP